MLCTPDLEILEVDGGDYAGMALLGVGVRSDVKRYLECADGVGLTTRSKLSRNGSYFTPSGREPGWLGRTLMADVEYHNLGVKVVYRLGDKVARAYALKGEERILGEELHRIVNDTMPGIVSPSGMEAMIDISDECIGLATTDGKASAEELLGDPDRFIRRDGRRNWNALGERITLLLTEPLAMPTDAYGLILGTTWQGQTAHIASTVVDPGWQGRLVLEVATHGDPTTINEKPRLLLAFYRATPSESLG